MNWIVDYNHTGGLLVSDAVNIEIEIEFKEVPELVEQAMPQEPVQVTA